jgi:3-isopropylmalate/(R)-2-methylmalate dehydratase small subunit
LSPFTQHTGIVAPLDRANVDTDQIIPKQFLKRVERTGFGEFLFFDWRYHEDGTVCPGFELNGPGYAGASILAAGRNFGSGSSREHAPWALLDYGFRAIIAPSFADIFYNNCFKNGMLPVALPEEQARRILENAQSDPGYRLCVDLVRQTVSDDRGFEASFDVDPFRRHCLLNGLDDIGLTLQYDTDIARFEASRPGWLPSARPSTQ